jgi:hypothetical protein
MRERLIEQILLDKHSFLLGIDHDSNPLAKKDKSSTCDIKRRERGEKGVFMKAVLATGV